MVGLQISFFGRLLGSAYASMALGGCWIEEYLVRRGWRARWSESTARRSAEGTRVDMKL